MAMKLLGTILLTLAIYPATLQSQWLPHRPPQLPLPQPENPRPLCISQLAIVNRACAFLPYSRVTPPSPPSPEEGDEEETGSGSGSGNHHHHHHNRRQRVGHVETPQEEECCRWLKQVDSVCVCDLLVRLPPFMTRPVHEYKVVVDESCEVSFACSSRLVKF